MAWRRWYLRNTAHGLRLCPLVSNINQHWKPGEPYCAYDATFDANSPRYQNSAKSLDLKTFYTSDAGIYAVKNYNQYDDEGGRELMYDIAGSVYLWGEVIEYTRGYRAQYAYPKHLWIEPHVIDNTHSIQSHESWLDTKMTRLAIAQELRRIYGVEVTVGSPE